MPILDPVVAAKLAGDSIGASFLVFMDFKDNPKRWWTGWGYLEAGGETWEGIGNLITMDGLEWQTGTAATQATFTLSGANPELVTLANDAAETVAGRRVVVSIQFHRVDADGNNQVGSNLAEPVAIWSGKMDQLQFSADGPSARTITLTAETLWAGRNRPRFGLYTDRDQQSRYPGDKFFEFVARYVNKVIRWPVF